MAAAEALDSCRIPWHDPNTGKSGFRRVVSLGDIPRGPHALDDDVRIIVDLPPGTGNGPLVDNQHPPVGCEKRPGVPPAAESGLCLVRTGTDAFPQRGRVAVATGRGLPTLNRYLELSDDELIRLAYPPWRERTNLRADVRRLVKMLEEANELRVVDGRILPPGNSEPDTD